MATLLFLALGIVLASADYLVEVPLDLSQEDDLTTTGIPTTTTILPSVPTPVVLWHGMGDSCCFKGSLGAIKQRIEQKIDGVYVLSLMIGNNEEEDMYNGYFKNSNDQITYACEVIGNNTRLQDGFHGVGFSQGGQFMRALVQRCPNAKVKRLITFGGQHQGVYGVPQCPGQEVTLCNLLRKLINYGAYRGFVQQHLVQAQYWHDPLNEAEYVKKSIFLADINNEKTPRNEEYKKNLLKLEQFIMVQFDNDTVVQPKETELFAFYKVGQATVIETLEESTLYKEDWLGLKALNETNRLLAIKVPGNHLQFSMEWFDSVIIDQYLR